MTLLPFLTAHLPNWLWLMLDWVLIVAFMHHSQDDTHVVFIGIFIGSFVRGYAKLLTEGVLSEKYTSCQKKHRNVINKSVCCAREGRCKIKRMLARPASCWHADYGENACRSYSSSIVSGGAGNSCLSFFPFSTAFSSASITTWMVQENIWEEDLSMSVLSHKQQRLEEETVFPHHFEEVSIGSTCCLIGRTSFY